MNQLANASPTPICTHDQSEGLTIADALRILATWEDLSPGRARKLRTALNTAARVLAPGMPPGSAAAVVPMTWPSLSRLHGPPPATFGLTGGRMTSLRSELRFVLRRLYAREPDRRGEGFRSDAITAQVANLPPYRRWALTHFLRYLDAEGIALAAVNNDTFNAYQAHCAAFTLHGIPRKLFGRSFRTWNWAHEHIPDWPGKPVRRPNRVETFTPPLTAYPASFQADVARYAERLRGRDIEHIFAEQIFDKDATRGPGATSGRALRSTTIGSRLAMIRRAAGALVSGGFDRERIVSLRDLVDPPDRPETILRFYLKRPDGTGNRPAAVIGTVLYGLARDYCCLPDEHVATLRAWASRLRPPKRTGMSDKNSRRLRGLMQPGVRAMLLGLPMELMKRAATLMRGTSAGEPRQAKAARMALCATAIEILLICPLRCANLIGLRLDRHLRRSDPRKGRFTDIVITADEMKNDTALHWPIPPESQKVIATYLTLYRPVLVAPGNPYLFGIKDKQRCVSGFAKSLSGIVTRETGVEFNLHLARHFAACNFLRVNPGQYEVVRQVLGHHDINVTMAHYVGLETDSAATHFDATVLRDRRALRGIAAHAFRKGAGGISTRQRRPRK